MANDLIFFFFFLVGNTLFFWGGRGNDLILIELYGGWQEYIFQLARIFSAIQAMDHADLDKNESDRFVRSSHRADRTGEW